VHRRAVRRSSCLVAVWLLACSEPYAARPPATSPTPGEAPASSAAPTTTTVPASSPAVATGPALQSAGELQYLEIVTGGAKADDRLPMIVAVHGLGDNPENFAHLFDTFSDRARVILPRGIDAHGDGWSWFPLRARDPDTEALARAIAAASDKLAASITAVAATRNTAGKPILTGFSQGGMLSFAVAVRHPDTIAVALPVGGWLPPPLWPTTKAAKGTPKIVAFHGTDDAAVEYGPTRDAVAALDGQGYAAELVTYPGIGHVITPEMQRDVFDRIVDAARVATSSKGTP
jgi:phospholipase/carboxylesterase